MMKWPNRGYTGPQGCVRDLLKVMGWSYYLGLKHTRDLFGPTKGSQYDEVWP